MERKNVLAILLTCIILVGSLAGISMASPPMEPQAAEILGSITMPGSAEIQTMPDWIVILLNIQARDKNSAVTAKDRVAQIIDRVLQSLRALGFTDDDIETTAYSIQMQYDWVNGVQVFREYLVSCSMKIIVKDFDKAGKVVDASVNAGAFVTSITFELSKEKREQLKTKMMAEAAKDARSKASAVMAALNQHLGRATSVSVQMNYQPVRAYYAEADALDSPSSEPPTTILPTDLKVSATLTVVFEILP